MVVRKTKLLFIMESLGIGGAEKSLLTLLSKLDCDAAASSTDFSFIEM